MNRSVMCTPTPGESAHTLLWRALERKSASSTSAIAMFWGSINIVLFAVLLLAVKVAATYENVIYWWALIGCLIICAMNLMIHLYHYIRPLHLAPIEVSGNQQKLLSLSDNECNTRKETIPNPSFQTPIKNNTSFSEMFRQSLVTPVNNSGNVTLMNTSALSWMSSYCASPANEDRTAHLSPNNSWMSNTSCDIGCICNACINKTAELGARGLVCSPKNLSNGFGLESTSSPNNSKLASSWQYFQNISSPHQNVSITNRSQLDEYISNMEHKKELSAITAPLNSGGPSSPVGLWYNGQHNALGDPTSALTLRRNLYQQATPDPVCLKDKVTPGGSDKSRDSFSSKDSMKAASIWTRRNVNQRQLFQFEENLRIWMSGSVLKPMVAAVDEVNKALADIAPDLQIGLVGVEKLRKVCSSQLPGVKYLGGLVPYLERAPTQQAYLVRRLRQLAEGGALSRFVWDKGEDWTDQCPSDALLLLELFGLYLDSQLPPDPRVTDGRVFSSKHIVTAPEKPTLSDYPVLHVSQVSPPHVRVFLPGEGECEVGEGHKNILHALLLFLHYLVHTQHSFIGGINLSLTGVNLAWIVSEEES